MTAINRTIVVEGDSRNLTLRVVQALNDTATAVSAATAAEQAAIRAEAAAVAAFTYSDLDALVSATRSFPLGTIIVTRSEKHSFEVVASNPDYTTAGGVMLRFVRINVNVFYDYEFINFQQIVHIRNGDVASQNESIVTAGLQDMHDAAMAWVEAGTDRTAVMQYSGKYAINDELFTEAFAQKLWDMPQGFSRFIFEGSAVFKTKNWPSHAAVRTSGLYAAEAITDPVPMAVFRWEQQVFAPTGPVIKGITIEGDEATTDPIGFKARRLNRFFSKDLHIKHLFNFGKFMEGIVNSDEYTPLLSRCGYQPTMAGGTGFVSPTATFSTVAGVGTTTVTASEAVFNSGHVGEWLMIEDAGGGGNVFSGHISGFTSGTQVVVDEQCTTNVSGKAGSFTVLTGSMTASGNTLTLDTSISTDLVGRYVAVMKAGSAEQPAQDLLVTRVTAQSGATLTLAHSAANTVSSVPVTVASANYVGFSSDYSAAQGTNNDYQVYGEGNENPRYSGVGAAPNAIYQLYRSSLINGGKYHGQSPLYNNFGGNWCSTIFDNSWNAMVDAAQFEHGGWHPEYGMFVIIGDRGQVQLTDIAFGAQVNLDKTAFFYVDPQEQNGGKTQIILSGHNTSSGSWPVTGQTMFRYGPRGVAEMVMASGPLVQRVVAGFPDMPETKVQGFNALGIARFGRFSSTGATTGKRFLDTNRVLQSSVDSTGGTQHHAFYNPNGLVGTISTSASATTFNTSSDERLKEDFSVLDAGGIIDSLESYSFTWKADGSAGHGVKAQEAHQVFPVAVSVGLGNPGDEDFIPWAVDYSKFVPLLLAEVKALRARVAKIEGA